MVNTKSVNQRYHRPMSEMPPSGPSYAQGASGFSTAPGSTGFPTVPAGSPPLVPARHTPSRWPTLAVLVVALIGVGVGIAAWLRPMPHMNPPATPNAPAYTRQQISDAKANACNAFEIVKTGTTLQARGGDPDGQPSDDPALRKAQAANARLSLVAGAWYLRDHLAPETPEPVAGAIRKLSATLMDIGLNYLAGAKNDDPPQATRLSEGESEMTNVTGLCK